MTQQSEHVKFDIINRETGGRRPFFGANTICFAAPCGNEQPLCVDMATSLVTWNKILQVRDHGGSIQQNWGVDEHGNDTQDAQRIAALHPIGGYKGFGLSMMVEVLCSALTGMPFGRHIVRMYADSLQQKRNLGHFFMALHIDSFVPIEEFKTRLQQMTDEVRTEPSKDSSAPVQVPGDPEKRTEKERQRFGIPLGGAELESLQILARQHALTFPSTLIKGRG